MPVNAGCAGATYQTHLAHSVYQITARANRHVNESGHFATNIFQDAGVYDLSVGCNPRKLRYSWAPTAKTRYAQLENCGEEETETEALGCDMTQTSFTVQGNKKMGCDLPKAHQLAMGRDVFTRSIEGLAFQSDPFCENDFALLPKEETQMFFSQLSEKIPEYMADNFEYELRHKVIEWGYNLSCQADGSFSYEQGQYGKAPTGQYTIPYLLRLKRILMREGWPRGEAFAIYTSRELALRAIDEDKRRNECGKVDPNLTINVNADMMAKYEKIYTEESFMYKGILFLITDTPVRATQLPQGLEFIEPYIAGTGTEGGTVWRYNEDYDKSKYTCNGQTSDVFEIALFGASTAVKRFKYGKINIPGKAQSLGSNFETRVVGGAHIECNPADEKHYIYSQHRVILEPCNPELLGTIASTYAPEVLYGLNCAGDDPVLTEGDPLPISDGNPPLADVCYREQCEPCDPANEPVELDPMPEKNNLCPDPEAPELVEKTDGGVAGNELLGEEKAEGTEEPNE